MRFSSFVAVAVTASASASCSAASVPAPVSSLPGRSLRRDNATGFEWNPEALKVAAIRYPPHNWAFPSIANSTWVDYSLNQTIANAVNLIKDAAAEGVKFVAFPEAYFPGYSKVLTSDNSLVNYAQYASQSMKHGSPEWETLMKAFADANIYGIVGWSERANNSLYLAQTLVGPQGAIWRHRKLRPSGAERNLWSDGDVSSIPTQKLPSAYVSMLSCYENEYADSRFIASSQQANIHVALFPYGVDVDPSDWNAPPYSTFHTVAQAYGMATGGASVILPAIGGSTIFDSHGIPLIETLTNDMASMEAMPYITASYNTTTWTTPEASVNGEFRCGNDVDHARLLGHGLEEPHERQG